LNDKNRTASAATDLESDISHAPSSEKASSPQDTRVNIYVRSYRRLNSDPDGISVKAALDGIVGIGILPDDSSKQVKSVTFETIKSKEEKTIIEILEEG
jgi:Holliday junction resolvase RusA-like endonuclease